MLPLIVAMILILVVAGAVLAFVAWPGRGREVPHAPWVDEGADEGVQKASDLLPMVDDGAHDAPDGTR